MLAWKILAYAMAALLAAGGTYLLARSLVLDRPRGRRRCPRCWYDMSGTPGLRCSECGREVAGERKLQKTRRHPMLAAVSLALLLAAAIASRTPAALEQRTWWALLPTPALVLLLQLRPLNQEAIADLVAAGPLAQRTSWERYLIGAWCGRALIEGDPGSQRTALFALPQLGYESRAAVPHILKIARAGGKDALVVRVIGSMGAGAEAAIPTLIDLAGSATSFNVRWAAAESLGTLQLHPRLVIPALAQLAREETRLAHTYAQALSKFGNPAAPAMIELLKVDRPDLKMALLYRLLFMGPFRPTDEAKIVRHCAALNTLELQFALGLRRSGGADPAATARMLCSIFDSTDDDNRLLMLRWAGTERTGFPESADLLTRALAHPRPLIRWFAIDVIASLDRQDRIRFEPLLEEVAEQDPDPDLRQRAAQLLSTGG
jgi:HEAT repeat protein